MMTKLLLIAFLTLTLISACAPRATGFCNIYTEVEMNREAATAVVRLNRIAAERLAVNEELYRSECK